MKMDEQEMDVQQRIFGEQMLIAIADKFTREEFNRYLDDYNRILDSIGFYNRKLANLDILAEEEHYNQTVSDVIEATKTYYQYLGTMPEEIRKFCLGAYESVDVNKQFDSIQGELNDLLQINLPNIRQIPPSIQSIRPKKYIMQIDAISSQLPLLDQNNSLKVGARGSQPVKTTVTLDIPEHMQIEGGTVLSTYDKSIINGVTSLLECGNNVFSIPMLYHAMTGKQNPTVDDQLLEEINGKLEKMRRMMLSIDLSEENRANFITSETGEPLRIENLVIEGYLLPLNKLTGVINGKKTELYQLIGTPPLYTYSKLKHQLASVSISLLNAPVNNNMTTIPLKTYLLQRIELMKNKNNSIASTTILYDAIYHELGDTQSNKTRKMRIRTYTSTILDYFLSMGYITGFSEFKAGRSIAGVRIEL